jgi:hypothetical protein
MTTRFTSCEVCSVRLASALAASSLLLAGLACGGGDLGLPAGPGPGEITVERVSGNAQNGEPGSQLGDPLVVRLVDEQGNGVGGQAVAWVVATGGGDARPGTSETNDEGFASTRWTLGDSPGVNTLNAVVSGVGVVNFTATGDDGGSGPSAELSTSPPRRPVSRPAPNSPPSRSPSATAREPRSPGPPSRCRHPASAICSRSHRG